ncbi:tRNA (adenosine(37)-N6)-threonylcarbamoyltransferase complex dimerization subunit type 1 TsaB [Gordonia sp. ABSL1-1]|uniref:tRNA (adenosine(37)-N6)-threonylcarbamoyltransferase complex dimerization subunit type 1 TsaB n=1 Tax=Gordonia sp. ABSL1-1 TaxID=3053923 RepID=UPI0025745AC8|nr:tRNA (adenosine(37)-N6)-threonylcarbamoyltransferase complex dimerization subunit type 1 TsaB [Gordonia sp. ABSL1-1]MDL9938315.1 tRNA (adenosine(37)-N6)-threonylcarbamoyltransferase complex dimerization subunit type 1 TsaB [Gordonia sp. ABSL1-1]
MPNGNGWMNMSSDGRKRVLIVDTATDAVVTGIAEIAETGIRVLAERTVADHRRHAELLTTLMAECLAESGVARSELDAVVTGTGPGPFTGLRVGMATGAAFADALSIPAHGVCSLDAIASDTVAAQPDSATVIAVTDARRREVYWALYRDGERVVGPEVQAPATVAQTLTGVDLDAAGGSPAQLALVGWTGGTPLVTVPTVAGLATVAARAVLDGVTPEPLVPLYLRRPDAVERKPRKPIEPKAAGAV